MRGESVREVRGEGVRGVRWRVCVREGRGCESEGESV